MSLLIYCTFCVCRTWHHIVHRQGKTYEGTCKRCNSKQFVTLNIQGGRNGN